MSETDVKCPNCSHQKVARYCAYCGQNHRDYRRSLPPMVVELLREAFELDGRILQSLKLLFFQPGQLSIEFSHNRRASHVSPVRLYLFASILFFFTLSQVTGSATVVDISVDDISVDGVEAVVTAEDDANVEQLLLLLEPSQAAKARRLLEQGDVARNWALRGLAAAAQERIDAGAEIGDTERFFYGQFIEVIDDPQDFLDRTVENAPISMFFLLPLYALLLKLVYVRQHKYYVEHLVYALHLHTFNFLVLTVQILLPEGGLWDNAAPALFIGFFVYYFMSLRRFYEQGFGITLVKFGFLCFVYSLMLFPSILATFLITATQL
jgi:hypothetical protein